MTKYDIMFEALQERVNSGELTVEEAEVLNDVAFEKYGEDETEYEEVTESSSDKEDEGVTYDEYLEAMEYELFGEATRLSKEIRKANNKAIQDVKRLEKEKTQIPCDSEHREERRKKLDELDAAIIRKHKLTEVDSLSAGKQAAKNLQQRNIDSGIESYFNKGRGDNRKSNQRETFNTTPSKKSLENKGTGEALKSKDCFGSKWYPIKK